MVVEVDWWESSGSGPGETGDSGGGSAPHLNPRFREDKGRKRMSGLGFSGPGLGATGGASALGKQFNFYTKEFILYCEV
jgi:hypothetical protein